MIQIIRTRAVIEFLFLFDLMYANNIHNNSTKFNKTLVNYLVGHINKIK